MKVVIQSQWRPHRQQSNQRGVGGRNQPNQSPSWPPEDGHRRGNFAGSTWVTVADSITFCLIIAQGQLCLCHCRTPGQTLGSWQTIQKHLLLLALPNPALAATAEGPSASKGYAKLWAVDEESKNTRHLPQTYCCKHGTDLSHPPCRKTISLLTGEAVARKWAVPNATEALQHLCITSEQRTPYCPRGQ